MKLPKKRTFVELPNGMVNVSPAGRNFSRKERNEFDKYDLERGLGAKRVEDFKKEFPHLALTYSIESQVSFDVPPTDRDKIYCLCHVKDDGFKLIHFFGDKTFKGGNDYEICHDSRVTVHAVKTPDNTIGILNRLFDIE